MKRVAFPFLAALLLVPLAPLNAADAPAKAGRFPAYRSYDEMANAAVPLLPEAIAVTTGPKAHWFGYYDKYELDSSGRYLLGMEVGFEHRLPKSGEAVKIGMVDLQEGNRWIELGESRAWCWQQGCMLQWRPGSDREVVWNDREGDRFVSRVLDVKTRKLRTLPRAVGHISPDGKLAVCEDFSRVWNFRPGYGYAGIPDPYTTQPAPAESGVWRMDMETGETRLLVSLADLVQVPYPNQQAGDKHYINHLQWSPDGKRFLMYDRWSGSGGMPTRVFTLAADGTDLRLLSKSGASHYIWRDQENVLIWTSDVNGYALFKDDNAAKMGEVLWKAPNGHQLYIPGTGNEWLITDTYARELYLYHLPTRSFVLLGKFPQDKAYAGEWRCDLHPRVSRDGKYVFFDSPHAGQGRQIYRIDISEITRQPPVAAAPARSFKEAASSAPGSPTIELPAWSGSADPVFSAMAFGSKATSYRIYGGDRDAQILYPQEWLPALFRRTLVLKAPLGAANELSWRFTGPQAGVDILASAQKLIIRPRFYDTPGYNEIQGKAGRHPEWSAEKEWVISGQLRAVTVQIDQGMNLSVALNGKPVFERKWGYDLTQHQIVMKGGGELPVQLLLPAPSNAVVTVNPSALHQCMSGFGGITTPTAYAELGAAGKRQWWQLVAEYNLLIQREYPNGSRLHEAMDNWDVLADASPHYYAANFPNGEISDFAYNRLIYALGGKVWFEFWDLPPWVGTDTEKYAAAMVNYCQTSLKKAGRAPQVVGIQNEHTHPVERLHAMVRALRRRLNEAGFQDVQIHTSNQAELRSGIEEIRKYKADPDVWSLIDYSASNVYDYQKHFYDLDGFDATLRQWRELTAPKPFLAVEFCIQKVEAQLPSYRPALIMAQLYHKLLTITDASALAYCWTLLNVVEPSFGWSRSLCVVDSTKGFVPSAVHQLRTFGAYSRRIKEGMTRVDTVANNPDLLTCAFTGDGGKATLVALNRSLVPVNLQVNWSQTTFKEMERVSPYCVNKVEPYVGETVVIGPGEIVTLTNVELNALPADFFSDHMTQ